MAGANYDASSGTAPADVTSYDYDSPVSEAGDITEKWKVVKKVIAEFEPVPPETPVISPKGAYGKVSLQLVNALLNNTVLAAISRPVASPMPLPFSDLRQSYGFALYEAQLLGPFSNWELVVMGLRDRASVFLDGQFVATLSRGKGDPKVSVSTKNTKAVLRILVENTGRVNFSPHMLDADKGITAGVTLDSMFVHGWQNWPLPLEAVPDVPPLSGSSSPLAAHFPGFYRGKFSISGTPLDTFIDTLGWTKGVMWINGHNLGRYWNVGPQRTLYVPAPWLITGENTIDIFELESSGSIVNLVSSPILG
jgi:beta-galactosidase